MNNQRKLKITIITSYAPSIINFKKAFVETLLAHGYLVEIVLPMDSKKEDLEALKKTNLTCILIPMFPHGMNPFKDFVTLLYLYRHLKKAKPDYVLAYTIKPVIYGLLAARLAKIKNRSALITGLGSMFLTVSLKRRLLLKLIKMQYRVSLKNAKSVIFQNSDDRDLFLQDKLINAEQSAIVNGSGIDLDHFTYSPLPKEESPLSFLMLARLIKDKGLYEFAKAARIIKNKYPSVKIFLAGGLHPNPSAIQMSEVDQWVKEGSLTYLGNLSDVRPTIQRSSVYVLPSYREGTPRSVLEAMSIGRPIITTDVPGCRETVIEGENGFLIPVKSVEALVKAMEKFILNSSLIQTMGKRSREIAEEKYEVHKVNQETLKAMGIKNVRHTSKN